MIKFKKLMLMTWRDIRATKFIGISNDKTNRCNPVAGWSYICGIHWICCFPLAVPWLIWPHSNSQNKSQLIFYSMTYFYACVVIRCQWSCRMISFFLSITNFGFPFHFMSSNRYLLALTHLACHWMPWIIWYSRCVCFFLLSAHSNDFWPDDRNTGNGA